MTSVNAQQTPPLQASQPRWSDVGMAAYLKIAILGGLLAWFFRMELTITVNQWISDPSWSHGFLIPLFSLYFLHQNRAKIIGLQTRPSWLFGLLGLVLTLALYFFNKFYLKIAYGDLLLFIAALGATTLFVGGWKLIYYTWLPIGYLFFAVPLPHRLYMQITMPLRQLAASASAALLNVFPHTEAAVRGVVIDVVYRGKPLEPSLDVAEACSGMRLLMAFVALGVAMAYLHQRPIWQRLVLLASTVPIAILCNVVRVFVTAMIYIYWDPYYAQGIYHDLLGMLMLPLAFAFYGGIAWLMSNLFIEEQEQKPQPQVIIARKNRPQE